METVYANAMTRWKEEVGAEAARLIETQGIRPEEAWVQAETIILNRRQQIRSEYASYQKVFAL